MSTVFDTEVVMKVNYMEFTSLFNNLKSDSLLLTSFEIFFTYLLFIIRIQRVKVLIFVFVRLNEIDFLLALNQNKVFRCRK